MKFGIHASMEDGSLGPHLFETILEDTNVSLLLDLRELVSGAEAVSISTPFSGQWFASNGYELQSESGCVVITTESFQFQAYLRGTNNTMQTETISFTAFERFLSRH